MLLKTGEIEAKNFGYANFIIDASGKLLSFVAIEVQSIDTTGNYQAERLAYLEKGSFGGKSTAGLNWENVNKRILPQIIYKGHALRAKVYGQAIIPEL